MIRPFARTISELVRSVEPTGEETELIHVTDVFFELPVIVGIRKSANGVEFLGDLPVWRWPTVFDPPLGRMRISCVMGGTA